MQSMPLLEELLVQSAALHNHLCPRQVLGVRMGLWAAELLDLELPQTDKRLLTLVETDGCFADGVSVATNCWVGRRTLRVEDYGKVAATFVDSQTGAAWRVTPKLTARDLAASYAPDAASRWHAMLLGYQRIPVGDLLAAQRVTLATPVEAIISRPACRVICSRCGEEIMNEREVEQNGTLLCRSCAGSAYYRALLPAAPDAAV